MFKWMYERATKDAVEFADKKVGPAKEVLTDSDLRMTVGVIITSLGLGFMASSIIRSELREESK